MSANWPSQVFLKISLQSISWGPEVLKQWVENREWAQRLGYHPSPAVFTFEYCIISAGWGYDYQPDVNTGCLTANEDKVRLWNEICKLLTLFLEVSSSINMPWQLSKEHTQTRGKLLQEKQWKHHSLHKLLVDERWIVTAEDKNEP